MSGNADKNENDINENLAEQPSSTSASSDKWPPYNGVIGCILRHFCFIGLMVMRKGRHLRRFLNRVLHSVLSAVDSARQRIVYFFKLFLVRNGISVELLTDTLKSLRNGSRAAKKRGIISLLLYWTVIILMVAIRAVVRFLCSINYIAPILAACMFMFIVHSALDVEFALKVHYNGEEIGYIADESVFEEAEKQMLGRIVFEDYIKPENTVPQFTIAAVDSEMLLSENELTDELIKASGNELLQATGLYINDEFIGAVEERRELIALLNSIKNKYRSLEPIEEREERIDFVKDVEPRDGLYPTSSVVDISVMDERLNREEEAEKIYITVAGDAPITIAQKNGVPYSQLKALNPDIEKKLLIGQEVLVKKSVPMLEVKVVRTETVEKEVNFKIEQIQDPNRYQGYVKITQKGKKGTSLVTSEVTYIDGIEVDRTVLNTEVVTEPVNEKIVVGGKFPLKQLPSSAMNTSSNIIWPTASGYVSCGFYGYWGHTGMDIASGTGTAIYAAASGVVTKVAYNTTGYGYHIIINHGGGVETLYAHNSKLHVKVGQWVEQGQLIASMGRTGRSTGTHLHFEVRVNGKYMNPANYVGTRCPY